MAGVYVESHSLGLQFTRIWWKKERINCCHLVLLRCIFLCDVYLMITLDAFSDFEFHFWQQEFALKYLHINDITSSQPKWQLSVKNQNCEEQTLAHYKENFVHYYNVVLMEIFNISSLKFDVKQPLCTNYRKQNYWWLLLNPYSQGTCTWMIIYIIALMLSCPDMGL